MRSSVLIFSTVIGLVSPVLVIAADDVRLIGKDFRVETVYGQYTFYRLIWDGDFAVDQNHTFNTLVGYHKEQFGDSFTPVHPGVGNPQPNGRTFYAVTTGYVARNKTHHIRTVLTTRNASGQTILSAVDDTVSIP